MANADRVVEILEEVRESAAEGGGLADRLVRVGRDATNVTGVGLSWMSGDEPGGMLAATDGPARLIEELQFSLGEGPCVDSLRTGMPVLHGDLARTASHLWPAFTAGALGGGIAAVFAFPLQIGAITLGALDLYRDVVGPLDGADLREAMALASAATAVLLHLQSASKAGEMHPELALSFIDRAAVHQATGMVAVQIESSLGDALSVMRARAFASGRSIVDVARDVVARRTRFNDEDR